jgi:hypothetical protein
MDFLVAFGILAVAIIPALFAIGRRHEHKIFLQKLFLIALAARVAASVIIYTFQLEDFFGPDAFTYDSFGNELCQHWLTRKSTLWWDYRLSPRSSGWGMFYWVALIYSVTGRNPLAVQLLNSLLGALTPVLIFYIAEDIYQYRMVSERAALLTAFFPSLILWSAQGLKDPIIIVALCAVILATLKLRARLAPGSLTLVALGFFVLYSMRFYVFYVMVAALLSSIMMGSAATFREFARQAAVLTAVGAVLIYAGGADQAMRQYNTINLETLQAIRHDQATRASSGFGADTDIRDEGGFWKVLPVGALYLIFAPFPWQLTNLRQAITLPEMIIWWALLPMLISGIWYTLRYRLASSSVVLLFTLGLTLAYALFQGNVGTAYRQRAQIIVFFFLFVAVGLTLRTVRKNAVRPGAPYGLAGTQVSALHRFPK